MSRVALQLRAGTIAELDELHRLDLLCFSPPFQFTRRMMAQAVSHCLTIIAEWSGILAGFVIVNTEWTAPLREAYVVTLDVHPDRRRQGIAEELMTAAEVCCRYHGAESVSLHVWQGNRAALCLYQKIGYAAAELETDYYGPGLHAFLCTKMLAGN